MALSRSGGLIAAREGLHLRSPSEAEVTEGLGRSRVGRSEVARAWASVLDELDRDERTGSTAAAVRAAVVAEAARLRGEGMGSSSPRVRVASILALESLAGASYDVDLEAVPVARVEDVGQEALL